MSQFLYELEIEKLVPLFQCAMLAGADPNNLAFIISPPNGLLPLHQITGIIDRHNGNYHIPEVDCPHCGFIGQGDYAKKDDNPYVTCRECATFCYMCILQIPIKPLLAVVLNKIDPINYPIEEEEISFSARIKRKFSKIFSL